MFPFITMIPAFTESRHVWGSMLPVLKAKALLAAVAAPAMMVAPFQLTTHSSALRNGPLPCAQISCAAAATSPLRLLKASRVVDASRLATRRRLP